MRTNCGKIESIDIKDGKVIIKKRVKHKRIEAGASTFPTRHETGQNALRTR